MHEAQHYKKNLQPEKALDCLLCAHHCRIKPEHRGLCQVRENRSGILYSLVYGKIVSENIDPIEKKPLFHILPGSLSYSVSTVGCNFRCLHCQNYEISQYPSEHYGDIPGRRRSPSEVVTAAKDNGCASISYTYIEPTIFYEFALDTARLAHEQGLKNIFVSNGYTAPAATRELAPVLTANNIDLKAFSDRFYREVCGARLRPVLDTIQLMRELGVWVEITTLIIPGWNDSDIELESIAKFINSVDPEMPWHVTAFHPTYKMIDRHPTHPGTLNKAREIGLASGLKFVYTGNAPGTNGENTSCPNCQRILIVRTGYSAETTGLTGDTCIACGTRIPGIFI
ncbi:MAG: AmmeMemoRadiSam system radical SAM enzyme [Desulfobulbaceae bacterium]|nr:AmmeMemoRadiSam system radical SAM enzyme [Desulfobulbaceae bacterium]